MSRLIDSKSRQIYYYNVQPIKEPEAEFNSRMNFWIKMNNIAIQNITVQKMKTA